MNQPIEHLRELNRIRLIGLALEHLQLEAIASAVIHIPGGDRVIAIGTPAQVRGLLSTMADSLSTNPGAGLTAQQIDKLLFAADLLEGVDCEDTAGDLRDIARGAV